MGLKTGGDTGRVGVIVALETQDRGRRFWGIRDLEESPGPYGRMEVAMLKSRNRGCKLRLT